MNLLRSICGFFGSSCASEESKATNEPPMAADLGQEEADLEKTGKKQMGHMEDTSGAKTSRKSPLKVAGSAAPNNSS